MKKRILKTNVNILAKDNLYKTVLFTFTWYRLLSVDPDYIVVSFKIKTIVKSSDPQCQYQTNFFINIHYTIIKKCT